MRTDEIHPGDLIGGKYRVRAILGRNHGLLLEAFHTEFDQRVVIKLLLPGRGDDREIERFRRESRTLAKLESEHVTRIVDVGTEPNGSFYFVRQYVEGTDLGTFIRQSQRIPLVDAVLMVLMAAEAVAETNANGIILRELQPSKLILTTRPGGSPLVKLTDFGTAKLMREATAPIAGDEATQTSVFGLSPYSSPELVRKAKSVDVRTDVWSLGAIFYELLTGMPPFSGEPTMLMLAITKQDPTPPSAARGDVPREVDEIVGWALAKDVEARYQNVHAFAHALTPFASNEGRVLIERIGRITETARSKKHGSLPPPSGFPSGRPVAIVRDQGPGMDGAHLLGGGYRSPSSVRPGPVSEPPPTSNPALPPAASSAAPPPPSIPPPPPLPAGMMSTLSDVPPPPGATKPAKGEPHPLDRKITVIALGIAVVVLPILVALVFLKREREGATADAAMASARAAAAQSAATPQPPAPPPPPVPPPPPAAKPAHPPVAPAAAPAPAPAPEPEAPTESGSQPSVHASRGGGHTAAAAPHEAPPAQAEVDGTLLAIAVGGSCAFAVNGASRGTSSSLKITLKPGTYSVTCRPSSGTVKSKSVTVRSGETAMAAFKL